MIAKPTVEELGIDPDAQEWQRSGGGAGAIEIAFARMTSAVSRAAGVVPGEAIVSGGSGATVACGNNDSDELAMPRDGDWILMRVADDPARRVLVFDRNEWECFLDGARNGEFNDAADNTVP
ncbi:MAG: DUF397 domain-containing protein [Streptosporangiaceae bacterium]